MRTISRVCASRGALVQCAANSERGARPWVSALAAANLLVSPMTMEAVYPSPAAAAYEAQQQQQQEQYRPDAYRPYQPKPLDKKKLYTELLFAIGLVFGMTFFLETSSLFPTIVAANKQFKSAKTKMDTEENFREEDEAMPPPTPLNPELKMQSMIEDARGGLDMVKKEASKSKQPTE